MRHPGRADEYKDNQTGLHIIRMSKIAALPGKAIDMTGHEYDLLADDASQLHKMARPTFPSSNKKYFKKV